MNKYWLGCVLILSIAARATSEDEENCDKLGVLLYEDLGCEPHVEDTKKCPSKYSCKGLKKWDNECYFRGKVYEAGKGVEDDLSSPSCDKACFCNKRGEGDEAKASFTCAVLDCPEWLGVHPKFGCSFKYTLGHCCTSGEICGSDLAKCEVNGKTHFEGQKFYPDNTCLECVCQQNFTGKLEAPFCKRVTCGQQLKSSTSANIQDRCAPLYYSGDILCCPRFWVCPNGKEAIEGEAKSDEVCQFGETTVKVGQFVQQENVDNPYGDKVVKVKCECSLPPLLTCKEVN